MTAPSDRTKVRRKADRAAYDAATVHSILDEALVCHVGFVVDGGPVVIPTLHARDGDTLYLHGSPASRMLRSMRSGEDICVTITLTDGIVLARAPFHSSMNYRSVVIFGRPRMVEDGAEKLRAFEVLTEHGTPGRWADCGRPTPKEINGTLVAALPITEASAKLRTGPPGDDAADYALPLWAGVIPLSLQAGDPIDDPRLGANIEVPGYLEGFRR